MSKDLSMIWLHWTNISIYYLNEACKFSINSRFTAEDYQVKFDNNTHRRQLVDSTQSMSKDLNMICLDLANILIYYLNEASKLSINHRFIISNTSMAEN